MNDPIPGEYFLLHTHLPIDGNLYNKLPIRLADGVSLASTPYHAVALGAPEGSSSEWHTGSGALEIRKRGLHLRIRLQLGQKAISQAVTLSLMAM